MDLQAIMNATAQIAGGVVLRPGVYRGAGGIAGVKIAYSLYQEQQEIADDDLVHVSFWDRTEINPPDEASGPDQNVYRHHIRMQLMLSPGRSDLPKAHGRLMPLLPLYMTAFNVNNVKLLATCSSSRVLESPGIVEAIYPDRIALEILLIVSEKEAVSRVA